MVLFKLVLCVTESEAVRLNLGVNDPRDDPFFMVAEPFDPLNAFDALDGLCRSRIVWGRVVVVLVGEEVWRWARVEDCGGEEEGGEMLRAVGRSL